MADAAAAKMPPDENRGPEILAICGSLVGIAMLVVMLRMWVRARIVQHVGPDDWTILAAMVCLLSFLSALMAEPHGERLNRPTRGPRGMNGAGNGVGG